MATNETQNAENQTNNLVIQALKKLSILNGGKLVKLDYAGSGDKVRYYYQLDRKDGLYRVEIRTVCGLGIHYDLDHEKFGVPYMSIQIAIYFNDEKILNNHFDTDNPLSTDDLKEIAKFQKNAGALQRAMDKLKNNKALNDLIDSDNPKKS